MQSYRPAPIDPSASARAFESRTVDSPGLKDYMLAHGHPASGWPVERWGLTELTLLALYDHPDLEVARAEARAAKADVAVATQRAPLAITPLVSHHSLENPDQFSPWSLGFDVEIPLGGGSMRQANQARYDYLAQAAALKVGSMAWEVRSRVRLRFLEHYANEAEIELLQTEVREREAMAGLLQRRLEAGFVSSVEVNSARLALVEARSRLEAARSSGSRTLAQLAEALALPLDSVQGMRFDFSEVESIAQPPQDRELRRAALLNRLDVRGKLLDYAAADASLKAEIARQYPTITLKPGFLWDQGDQVWFLAATLIPAVLGNRPAIAAAEARREVQASQFHALQDKVIAQAQGAETVYATFVQAAVHAEQIAALGTARTRQIEQQLEAGYADRVELTAVRLEAVAAQRGALSLRVETLRAEGVLEDALQVPLGTGPFPQFDAPAPSSTGLARQ